MTPPTRNCLTCDRPKKVVRLDKPSDCFYAWTPAGEILGRADSTCHDDCRLGGWVPSRRPKPGN